MADTPKKRKARDTSTVAATPIRTVRVADVAWERAQDVAHLERTSVSTVIRFALTAYAKDPEAFWAGITAITHGELRDDEDAS